MIDRSAGRTERGEILKADVIMDVDSRCKVEDKIFMSEVQGCDRIRTIQRSMLHKSNVRAMMVTYTHWSYLLKRKPQLVQPEYRKGGRGVRACV